jgi:serine/threonine-protein kinase
MIGTPSPWLTLVACCVGVALPMQAHAEAGAAQKAAAESLFDDGLKAMKSGHFAEACPKLEESERIDPGIGTLLYLGECYEKTGRSASAWATFREAASAAQAQGETDRARVAATRADRLQPSLSKLTIRVAPETAQLTSLRVTRDSATLASALFNVAIPVDPGKYHVVASADGYQSFETDIDVAANGDSKSLEIPSLRAAPPGSAPVAPPGATSGTASGAAATSTLPPAPPEASHASGLRTASYVTGALGLVGLGIGSYFGVKAISKNSDAESHCPRGNLCDDAQGVQLTQDAKSAAVVSNITIGLGAAFAIAGVVLYLSSEHREKAAHIELHPLLSRDLAGIGLGGAFQ